MSVAVGGIRFEAGCLKLLFGQVTWRQCAAKTGSTNWADGREAVVQLHTTGQFVAGCFHLFRHNRD